MLWPWFRLATYMRGAMSRSLSAVTTILTLSPTPALLSNGAAFGVSPVGGKTVYSTCVKGWDSACVSVAAWAASIDPTIEAAAAATAITSASPATLNEPRRAPVLV
ncbi:MAG: hypothetical protein OXU61_06685 [Gammaproteobacteria bacterium]|nr:hypothetical protein [Gammaproteobacteria bacterium]